MFHALYVYRSFVICAGGKKQHRHVHVIFYVFNRLQAAGGRCSHICECNVAPHYPSCKHAFTPTQTAIHCSRAGCHVHLLTLVRNTAPETLRYTTVSKQP